MNWFAVAFKVTLGILAALVLVWVLVVGGCLALLGSVVEPSKPTPAKTPVKKAIK